MILGGIIQYIQCGSSEAPVFSVSHVEEGTLDKVIVLLYA